MGNSRSAKRKLNQNYVWTAKRVEQKKVELAKKFVEERAKTDSEFAKDLLKFIGEGLPPEIKKIAEETITKEKEKLNANYGKIGDGGCDYVDVPKEELLKSLETASIKHTEDLKRAGLYPESPTECCGGDCHCHEKLVHQENGTKLEKNLSSS